MNQQTNTSRAETGDELLDRQGGGAQRDVYDDMLEDPEVRGVVKEQLKRFAAQGYQANAQPQQQQAQPDPVQEVKNEIKTHEKWIEEFFAKEQDKRDYNEYERRRSKIDMLERQRRELREQRIEMQQAVQRSDQVIDAWINREKAVNPKLEKYADKVRNIAKQLRPDILANSQTLTNALGQMIEPRAYKEWREEQERKNRQAQTQRRDTAPGDAYTDEDDEMDNQPKDKYADAGPEEREFLRGLGLIKPGGQDEAKESELIFKENGEVIIPIGRGKRNRDR